ncbi:SDR family oxidoreductase [Solirubrobacter soli]|uniref:SDR family oxidoreductase n=1 Tax=Solirubrobacter soli TaxID=363832 RepID=UPI000408D449|nr:SDR family oxidoreductase [Solirubrobacter soli]
MTDLTGQVAVVTGLSGRLGPVWAKALRDAGATVVGVDLNAGENVYAADVTDRAGMDAAREQITADHGAPTILVNNAGIDQPPGAGGTGYAIEDVPLEAFTKTVDVNLAGTFNAIQVFGPAMVAAGRGSIVNIGSLYASIAPEPAFYDHIPGFLKPAAYGASKAAVLNLTRYFARLWGPHGVRVNAISPGGVEGGQDAEFLAKYTARVPLGRMAQEADLGGPLVFLASEASRYVTGQHLQVDGGFTV